MNKIQSFSLLAVLILSAIPSFANEYNYLECKGSHQWFDEKKKPTTNMMQRIRITLDEPSEKIIVSTDLYPSTAWRWATFDKNQIRTEAKNDSAEDLLIINRDTGNYTLSGYFGKGYSKIVYFKAEGNCKPKDPA